MIFVTVGAQMPFDRLVGAVDRWAGLHHRTDVYAQIGETGTAPEHVRWSRFDAPGDFRRLVEEADLIVAHAGMGTILTALELGKPILVMPRRAALRETRNDHQVATARQLSLQGLVNVAWDEHELVEILDRQLGLLAAADKVAGHATGALCETLSTFLERPRAGAVDGVICFGGVDWWYHNRGHYDIQMMREFSRRVPVLYVNSIGMRTPKVGEGRVFVRRVGRKLHSWCRGFKMVRDNFGVLSPVSIPKFHGTAVARALLVEQVQDAARWMGIRHPLVWVACPPAVEVLDRIRAAGVVYQRTDRFEHFPGVDGARIRSYDTLLKQEADLTVFCSSSVYEDERSACRAAAFIDHGVDYRDFVLADEARREPDDVASIARPRIGFVGGIDAWTFDPDLFNRVAEAMPDCSFVLVGGCSLPEGWCALENVHLLGKKPYEEVAAYMAACDVLMMPWNKSEWIRACNPVKLKEYLAVGRPVVSTPFDELSRYRDVVRVADEPEGFVREIRVALASPPDKDRLRGRVKAETWSAKSDAAIQALKKTGIRFRKSVEAVPAAAAATDNPAAEHNREPQPTVGARDGVRTRWRRRHLLAAAFLAVLGMWITRDAWYDIFRLAAKDEESSHIWLVLPVAAWLTWVRRSEARQTRRTGTLVGPLFVLAGWLLYVVGDTQLYQSMWHLGAIAITVGCALSVLGSGVLVRLWPAFLVLLFLIPVPGVIRQEFALPLQVVTARMTAFVLDLLGTPVTITGSVLVINDVSVGIAEACNGVRMMFALTLVCFLYAFGEDLSTRARLTVLLASPFVAVGANVVRLVPTVWLYGYADESTALAFHNVSGWAMMPLALLALFFTGGVLRWIRRGAARERAASVPVAASHA